MFRSLWFRLTGTVFFVVVVTMLVALIASLVIMRSEFTDFVNTAVENIQLTVGENSGDAVVFNVPEPQVPETLSTRFPNLDLEWLPRVTSVDVPRVVQNEATQFLTTMRDTILIAVSVSGGLAILASTWLFWQITRPLSRLRTAVEAVAGGDLQARVPVKSKDEVGRVAEAFNTMADELERQEQLRKQMVADVAHELRTPLSVMRGNLEAMIDELIPASEEELDAVHQEVLRLGRLVEDLRLLSLADAGELELVRERIDAAALVETAVRRLMPVAQAKEVTLAGDIGRTQGAIMGDEDKLQQVLANLIGNAIRHTPPGGRVTVKAQASGEEVSLVIGDQGPGVAPDDLPYLFERLWKGDRARTRGGDGGSGLGLSIVRQLVELHGGRVEASLPQEGGLRVTVTLPAAS